MNTPQLFIVTSFIWSVLAYADAPRWTTQDTQSRKGNMLSIVCNGKGPSEYLARQAAINSCKATAVDQLNGSVMVSSLTVETEKVGPSFHQEVRSDKRAMNLICTIKNEFRQTLEDGVTAVVVKCDFDLSKAEIADVHADRSKGGPEAGSIIAKPPTDAVDTSTQLGKITQDSAKQILFTSFPNCVDILVIGGDQPRTISCDSTPKLIVVFPTDREVVVRGPDGYKPKHLPLFRNRTPATVSNVERVEVRLEK